MHHKRGRPKNARAGCLLCHGHKQNGLSVRKRTAPGPLRKMQESPEAIRSACEAIDYADPPATEEFCACPVCSHLCPHGNPRVVFGVVGAWNDRDERGWVPVPTTGPDAPRWLRCPGCAEYEAVVAAGAPPGDVGGGARLRAPLLRARLYRAA
jgi:hypothetical protein